MDYPKGNLVAIGGAINNKGQEEQRLDQYEEGILEQIVAIASSEHKPIIEIITSASLVPDDAAADYLECFSKLGCKKANHLKITTRKEAQQQKYIDRIRSCDCVVFTGGDQLRLCSLLGGTPVIDIIKKKYMEEAFTVAGVSAGAAAMSQTMISSGTHGKGYRKGDIELSLGFGFLHDVIVDTHFDRRGRFGRLVQAVLTQPGAIGIGLGEDTGVVVCKGHEMKAIGSSSVVIIDGTGIQYSNIASIDRGMAISAEDLKVHLMSNGDVYKIANRKYRGALSTDEQEPEALPRVEKIIQEQ